MPEKTVMKYLEDIRDYSQKAIDYLNNVTYNEFLIDLEIVWYTVKIDFPKLRNYIENVIKEEQKLFQKVESNY